MKIQGKTKHSSLFKLSHVSPNFNFFNNQSLDLLSIIYNSFKLFLIIKIMHTNLDFCNGIGLINVFNSLIKNQIKTKFNIIFMINKNNSNVI